MDVVCPYVDEVFRHRPSTERGQSLYSPRSLSTLTALTSVTDRAHSSAKAFFVPINKGIRQRICFKMIDENNYSLFFRQFSAVLREQCGSIVTEKQLERGEKET